MANHAHHPHENYPHHRHADTASRAFQWGIGLNLLFVAVELAIGWRVDSLSLLSDAGHNFSDVISLVLAFAASKLATLKPTPRFTFGFAKSTILVSLANALLLLVAVGAIVVTAVQRFDAPIETPGGIVAAVAGFGIVVNAASAFLFFKNKDHDLNTRGAYLHLLADAVVSAAVLFAGLLMQKTGWRWLDPAVSIGVAMVILGSTWSLLRDSLRLSLDGVPPEIEPSRVAAVLEKIEAVVDVHHIHIWPLSTTENAITLHVTISKSMNWLEIERLKNTIRHELEHVGIRHSTIEIEPEGVDMSSLGPIEKHGAADCL